MFDPIGGPIGVALAEELGARAVLITQDHIAGNELSRTGDLAPANVRLAQAACASSDARCCAPSGPARSSWRTASPASAARCRARVVDCGFRLPTDRLADADLQAGDCVAPRTILEAVLEGRRAAVAVDHADRRVHESTALTGPEREHPAGHGVSR